MKIFSKDVAPTNQKDPETKSESERNTPFYQLSFDEDPMTTSPKEKVKTESSSFMSALSKPRVEMSEYDHESSLLLEIPRLKRLESLLAAPIMDSKDSTQYIHEHNYTGSSISSSCQKNVVNQSQKMVEENLGKVPADRQFPPRKVKTISTVSPFLVPLKKGKSHVRASSSDSNLGRLDASLRDKLYPMQDSLNFDSNSFVGGTFYGALPRRPKATDIVHPTSPRGLYHLRSSSTVSTSTSDKEAVMRDVFHHQRTKSSDNPSLIHESNFMGFSARTEASHIPSWNFQVSI
jgi:hypothetical protein